MDQLIMDIKRDPTQVLRPGLKLRRNISMSGIFFIPFFLPDQILAISETAFQFRGCTFTPRTPAANSTAALGAHLTLTAIRAFFFVGIRGQGLLYG
jgi:hypothetical protein